MHSKVTHASNQCLSPTDFQQLEQSPPDGISFRDLFAHHSIPLEQSQNDPTIVTSLLFVGSADSTALTFLAHFEESRLRETQKLIQSTDTADCHYVCTTSNNPLLTMEMERHRRAAMYQQNKLDQLWMQRNTIWSPEQIANIIRFFEMYQNQATI
jgi:hypothetical protein